MTTNETKGASLAAQRSMRPPHQGSSSERPFDYEQARGVVLGVLRRLRVGQPDDDMIAAGLEGYVRAWRRFRPGEGSCLKTYAWACARGAILDHFRRERMFGRREGERTHERAGFFEDALAAPEPNPHELNAKAHEWLLLLDRLQTLSKRERALLRGYYLEGRDLQDVGRELGWKDSGQITRIHQRAIAKLKTSIETRPSVRRKSINARRDYHRQWRKEVVAEGGERLERVRRNGRKYARRVAAEQKAERDARIRAEPVIMSCMCCGVQWCLIPRPGRKRRYCSLKCQHTGCSRKKSRERGRVFTCKLERCTVQWCPVSVGDAGGKGRHKRFCCDEHKREHRNAYSRAWQRRQKTKAA